MSGLPLFNDRDLKMMRVLRKTRFVFKLGIEPGTLDPKPSMLSICSICSLHDQALRLVALRLVVIRHCCVYQFTVNKVHRYSIVMG